MKYLALALSVVLTSCGTVPPNSVGEKAPIGIHIDMTISDDLISQLKEVQECTGIRHHGTFNSLAVVMMPSVFPCVSNVGGCSGEFVPPNIIKLGNQSIWKHEVVHALLFAKHGKPDAGHKSEFFRTCG